MAAEYDVIVIGGGLGGLTAAALVAKAGRKTLLIERSHSLGGAASSYKAGDLFIEAALHETSDPRDPLDPKHAVLSQLGVLDEIKWIPVGPLFDVRGGPVGAPFTLPANAAQARAALAERFPRHRAAIDEIVQEIETIEARPPQALLQGPSLAARLERAFGDDEAIKFALAGNLPYWHDDPAGMSWNLFALAQGGLFRTGGVYIHGGSHRLGHVLAKTLRGAGGAMLRSQDVCEILIGDDGRPKGVAYRPVKGGDTVHAHAPVVLGNAAPSVISGLLPAALRPAFDATYAARPPSISLFALTLGLSAPAATVGLTGYSTVLLPDWMTRYSDFGRSGAMLASPPGDDMPPLIVANYSVIDNGQGGPPHTVFVAGVDRLDNWNGLDGDAYRAKRDLWRAAIVKAIDRDYPGFAGLIVASAFNTASTVKLFLNSPNGSIYGFAPVVDASGNAIGGERSPVTAVPGLLLASAYASVGGFNGAILGGVAAAQQVLKAG